ncbi:MAG: ferrochelatase [Bacteroidales bacterium]
MKGVVLVNIGSPNAPDAKSAAEYLRQFLMDGEVMRLPFLLRYLLVNGIIVPFRKNHTAALYRSVWSSEGAPLKVITNELVSKLKRKNDAKTMFITQAMRYGQPSVKMAVEELKSYGVTEVLFLLLYPQLTGSTVISARNEIMSVMANNYPQAKYSFLDSFYNVPEYLNCLTRSISEANVQSCDKLVITFHGIPLSHLPCTDACAKACNQEWKGCRREKQPNKECYRYQCYEVADAIRKSGVFESGKIEVAFQSRLGKGEWLRPYLSDRMMKLPTEGVNNIAVIAPSFPIDCLETLYEIKDEAKKTFFTSGGTDFLYISCLNDRDDWSSVLDEWIKSWSITA